MTDIMREQMGNYCSSQQGLKQALSGVLFKLNWCIYHHIMLLVNDSYYERTDGQLLKSTGDQGSSINRQENKGIDMCSVPIRESLPTQLLR